MISKIRIDSLVVDRKNRIQSRFKKLSCFSLDRAGVDGKARSSGTRTLIIISAYLNDQKLFKFTLTLNPPRHNRSQSR